MPNLLTEPKYPFEFLIGPRSDMQVERVTIASGQNLGVAAIIAKTFVGTGTGTFASGNTGNPTIASIVAGSRALPGEYRVVFTAATAFQVYDPAGRFLGTGATGSSFNARDILSFTITAGGTAAVAGDLCTINVVEGASTWSAATGSNAAAILAEAVNATDAATTGLAIVRLAEVNKNKLDYGSMNSAAKVNADLALARQHIIVRSGF